MDRSLPIRCNYTLVEIDYYFGTTGIAEGILGQGALSDNKGMLELDDCTDLVRRLRSNRRQNKEVREQKQIQIRKKTVAREPD